MTGADSGRPPPEAFYRVDDPRQAKLLTDEASRACFRPFLARELSAAQAARELGIRLDALLYRVRVFERVGLLRVVRCEPRRGRPIKIYRSSADAYFVPHRLTAHADLEESFYRSFEPTLRQLAAAAARRYRDGWDGYRFYRAADGHAWMEGAPQHDRYPDLDDPGRQISFDFNLEAWLDEAQARELQAELVALLNRYRRYQSPGPGRRYLLAAFLGDLSES
ncbi:hypothetical protein HNR42_001404 [Deinobacterium chartae]|uniref:Uncharacterized protein n=1 Tax=Deinobacterium chartae TaxID=521158 RepID=A0A841HWS2_9DEIO|nr:helix-turn-helix domain-containing protein [Deinobacterium chartae]MBB6097981.1 hypothetical protein [Deinobacterium chartae]